MARFQFSIRFSANIITFFFNQHKILNILDFYSSKINNISVSLNSQFMLGEATVPDLQAPAISREKESSSSRIVITFTKIVTSVSSIINFITQFLLPKGKCEISIKKIRLVDPRVIRYRSD